MPVMTRISLPTVLTLLGFLLTSEAVSAAPACTPPASGNWTVTQSCDLAPSAVILGDVTVQNNATLTVENNRYLAVDFRVNEVRVRDGSKLVIKSGGRLFRHPIHHDMVNNTDGTIGYYLKRVGGSIVDQFNQNTQFYPASTIKVLQHLHAMRAVQAGTATLLGTNLTVCPGNNTNCSDNANTNANCGANTINENLQTAILRMMTPSDNQSTNAIQELFGTGTPSVGRAAMNLTGTNIVGWSNASVLQHKLACGNVVTNNPFNTLTLADIGLLYEQTMTNNAVLQPGTRTQFRNLMQNETGGLIGGQQDFFIQNVITQEAGELGFTNTDLNNFLAQTQQIHKAGNLPGNNYLSIAGWVRLPTNNGAQNRQYVYGVFIDNATFNNAPGIRTLARELMRGEIQNALESF
jgi:hypothetical protein